MAVYEITNVENTGPFSQIKPIKKFQKIDNFHINVALFNSQENTERSKCIDKNIFGRHKKVRFKHSDDLYKLSHVCENSGLINSVKSNYL